MSSPLEPGAGAEGVSLQRWRRLLAPWGAHAAAFLSWWLHELREMAEAILVRVAPHLATHTVVRLRGPTVSLEAIRGSTSIESLQFTSILQARAGAPPGAPKVDPEWLPDTLQSPGVLASMHGTRTTLGLDRRSVLIHDLEFPSAVQRDLEAAIQLYAERELPVSSQLVCLDWRVVHRDRQRQRVSVRMFAAHRGVVDQLYERARGWGLRPVRIAVAEVESEANAGTDAKPAGDLVGNFRPTASGVARMHITSLERRLGFGAAALGAAALLVILGQSLYERRVVGGELRRTERVAQTSADLARRFNLESAAAVALTRTMAEPDAADALADLTTAIPTDSWIYELEISPAQGREMQLRLSGFTPTATQFADLLAKRPQIKSVRLVSATSAGLGTGKDRLQIAARWTGK